MKRTRNEDDKRWYGAGLSDPKDTALGRPRDLAPLLVPLRIEIDESGKWLRWGDLNHLVIREQYLPVISISHRERRVPTDLLNRFVRLSKAPPEGILTFARDFGPLHLCKKHDAPHTHAVVIQRGGGLKYLCGVAPVPGREGWLQEPIAGWHRIAASMRECLDAAAALSTERRRRAADEEWEPDPLGEEVNLWLACGAIRPVFNLGGESATLTLEPLGLLGVLALQLADAASGPPGLAICSGCGDHYTPEKRRPRAGKRRYCKKCRDANIPDRDAQREYRQRQRARAAAIG